MREGQQEPLLTVDEVAQCLRVDPSTVRRWIKSGTLQAVSLPCIGRRQIRRIKQSTLGALLRSSQPQ
ncbi:MAG TPA: helix-turn-helix domain-containing protein [Ktedonosporobacter sp.]|nr:helix-turn-helix domain-containing protein [Ktedonosporobacter sp.]